MTNSESTTVRARVRRPGAGWRTTAIKVSGYASRRKQNNRNRADYTTYVSITDSHTGQELQLRWGDIKRLHDLIGEAISHGASERDRLIERDKDKDGLGIA